MNSRIRLKLLLLLLVLIIYLLWSIPPPPPSPKQIRLRFTYENGDVIGGFAHKVAEAMTRLGVAVECRPQWDSADLFWHTSYRAHAWNRNPPFESHQLVWYNLENMQVPPSVGATILMTSKPAANIQNPRVLHVPWAWVAFEDRKHKPNATFLLRGPRFDARSVLASKSRFCSFFASFCLYEKSYLGIYGHHLNGIKQQRTIFYEQLNNTYKAVDALGGCYRNREQPPIPESLRKKYPGWTYFDSFIYFMRDYKFVMSMENWSSPGYFTEKLFNAYLGETIPIYWGAPDIDEFVNTDAFVWCKQWDTCLKRVRELDENDDLYRHMLSQPILKENKIPDWMSFDVLAKRLIRAWDIGE